jgi:hypothetical protein
MRKMFIFLTVLALVLGMSVCAYAQEDKQEVISEDTSVEAVAETEVEEPVAEEPAVSEAEVEETEATEESEIEEPVAEEPTVDASEAEEADVDETEAVEAEESTAEELAADEDAAEDEEETPNLTPVVRKVHSAALKGDTVISVAVPEAYESMLLEALEAELPDDVEIVGFEVENGMITSVILSFEEAEADANVDETEDAAETSELEAPEMDSDAEVAEEPETSEVKPVVAGHVPAETPVETSEDSERKSEVIADAKAEEKYLFSEE